MKSYLKLLLVPMVTLVFAGAAVAQGTGPTGGTGTKAAGSTSTKTTEKKTAAAKVQRARGDLTAADAKAGTAKVKTKEKELSLTAESQETKDSLAKVKVGDAVRIAYEEKDGKLTLRSIAKSKGSAPAKTTTPTKSTGPSGPTK
jgi:hypothetical protein